MGDMSTDDFVRLVKTTIEVIGAGLIEGACPILVRCSARLLQTYELDFWQRPPSAPAPRCP